MSQSVLVLGATSAIAQAAAKVFADRGASLYLAARDNEKLETVKQDLVVRGADKVGVYLCDLSHIEQHEHLLEEAKTFLGEIDVAILAYGVLGNQKHGEQNFDQVQEVFWTNLLSPLSFLTRLAMYFEERKAGTVAIISSVAGDRGRASNYIYGSSKAGLSVFTDGLRGRLAESGVSVLTIKPGFVDTPMTADIDKNPLFASADAVGRGIVNAIDRKKNVVYLPWYWRFIMLGIRAIPEMFFKKMSI